MPKAISIAAFALLVLAGAAQAQVTGVVTQSTASLRFNPGVDFGTGGVVTYSGQNETGLVYDGGASTSNFQVTTLLAPNDIHFANGATSSGPFTFSTTSTSIAVSFRNDGPAAVTPQLQSTILPGGFGFYLGDTSGCQVFNTASCPQAAAASGLGFKDLTPNPGASSGTELGGASFTFTISDDTSVIESLSAFIRLDYNAADPASPTLVTSLTGFASSLANFRQLTPTGSDSALGYQWDETGLLVNFLSGPLAPGDSDTLNYTTVVSTYTVANCDAACSLVAYGGFGDPIGKSGGTGTNVVGGPTILAGRAAPGGVVGSIGGVSYGKFNYNRPTYVNGVLSFTASAVPEPASWGLGLIGMGLVGLGLRRRSRPAATF